MKLSEIISKDNSKIKYLKKINNKKYRQETNSFFIENFKTIKDALNSGYCFEQLYVTSAFLKKHKEYLEKLTLKAKVFQIYVLADKLSSQFSNLSSPSGICAVYFIEKKKIQKNKSLVYLNNINDPGNLGAILRTALAFGFKNVVLDKNCADLYNYKTLAASKDSIFKLNIIKDESFQELVNIKKDMKIIVSSLDGDTNYNAIIKEKPVCIVFGNEASGVSDEVLGLADYKIKISIKDTESLNVVSAASVILYKFHE